MADQTAAVRNSLSILTCPNHFHNGVGHTLLFPALIEENQVAGNVQTSTLIKKCLLKSGLPCHGLESLQLHSCLFHHCFLSSTPAGTRVGKDACESVDLDVVGFSSDDYFDAVLDQQLGWFRYYKQMIPYMRLPLAGKVVTSLAEFCSQRSRVTSSIEQTALMNLLASTSEIVFSIIYDFCPRLEGTRENDQIYHGSTSSRDGAHNTPSAYFQGLCEQLSLNVAGCLEVLLNRLVEADKGFGCCNNMVGKNLEEFKYVVEMLALTMVLANPFCGTNEIKMNFKQLLIGSVDLSHLPQSSERLEKNSDHNPRTCRSSSGLGNIPKQVVVERLRQIIAIQSNGMLSNPEAETKREISDTLCTSNFECDSFSSNNANARVYNTATASPSVVADCDVIKETKCSNNNVSEGSDLSYFLLLKSLKESISTKLFIEVIRYFSRGEESIHQVFYNNLSVIIADKNHVRIGDHFICGQKLFSQMEELLAAMTSKRKLLVKSDDEDLSKLLEYLKIYPYRKLFSLSSAEKVLASPRLLSGKEDLTLVQLAVKERMPGWLELIVLGLQNSDFENWWNHGFYDLVVQKVDILSTESNVKQVLSVLYGLSQEGAICWTNVEKMISLLTVMLTRLPSLLQERVILEGPVKNHLSPPNLQHEAATESSLMRDDDDDKVSSHVTTKIEGTSDWLHCLKDRQEVLREITPLLNRITSDNFHQLLSQVLVLCLYCKEAVLTQALQVAVDNKGQVEPVVMLLRHMPGVCNTLDQSSGHSLLIACLKRVVCSSVLDERAEENAVNMLNLLMQGYDRLLNSSPKTSQWLDGGVVCVTDFMEMVLLPVLDGQEMVAKQNELSEKAHLPVSIVVQCLSGLITTISSDKFHCLHSVVLVQTLASLCVRHWPLVTDGGGGHAAGGGDGGGGGHGHAGGGRFVGEGDSRTIWLRARNCLDCLMERMKTEVTLDSISLDWLVKASYLQGGFPSLVLLYPLIQQHSGLQMASILESLVKEMTFKLGACSVLSTLLGLGQSNEAICEAVMGFVDTDVTMATLPVSRKHLTSVMTQIVCQSCSCDMPRLCRILRCLVSRYVAGREEPNQDLVRFIHWNSLANATDCEVKCLCVQYLTDCLMWMLTNQDAAVTATVTTRAVANYQMACQSLLAEPGQDELLIYTVEQCCSLLCLSSLGSTLPQTLQGLHVLAMNLLTSLRGVVSQENNGGEGGGGEMTKENRDIEQKNYQYCKPKYDTESVLKEREKTTCGNERRNEGVGCSGFDESNGKVIDGCSDKVKKVNGGDSGGLNCDWNECKREKKMGEGKGEKEISIIRSRREGLNIELFLSLRDVVVCVQDASIRKQLVNQLGKVVTMVNT